MRIKVCATNNSRAFASAIASALARDATLPGIILVFGSSGAGKTAITANSAVKLGATFVTAPPLWNPRWMLSDIITQGFGAQVPYLTQARYEFIVNALEGNPRPIFIDEADRIAKSEILCETLRAIHDRTSAPIILIGMDQFKKSAMSRPQLHRRIIKEVEFKPSSLDDSRLLATELAEVRVADDLVEALHRKTRGSAGLLVKELAAVEGFCRRRALKGISLADYPMDDSTPPPVNRRPDLAAAA